VLLPFLLYLSLVNDVRDLIAKHDLAAAERMVRTSEARAGASSEIAAALSWMARAELDAKRFEQADKYASEARKMALELMRSRSLDRDPWLPTALGAAIEVHAQATAARGERAEAIAFLREQLNLYGGTSIAMRIRKDLNLLNLVGKPAPPLDESDWIGSKPQPLSAYRGRPVLLFFWAHWCGDCKADAPAIAAVANAFRSDGLVLIAPTRLYGYVAGGQDAPPAAEKPYIDRVRRQFYPMLEGVPMPLSDRNFVEYGGSSTPTIVLLDSKGIVRFYHPGPVTEQELSARIRTVLGKRR
jgi:thiol-disulfide isomerase/thioredoxin